MRHLKTFESYQSVNEEFIGKFFRNLFSKAKNAFRKWRNRRQKNIAMKFISALEKNKNNPEVQRLVNSITSKIEQLPQSDKEKLQDAISGGELVQEMYNESVRDIIKATTGFFGYVGVFGGVLGTIISEAIDMYQLTMQGTYEGVTPEEIAVIVTVFAISGPLAIIHNFMDMADKDRETERVEERYNRW